MPTRDLGRLSVRHWLIGLSVPLALACQGGSGGMAPTSPVGPQTFDVSFVDSSPAPGGTLQLVPPNNTPVALSITFSVSVPAAQAGTYNWNTAVQAQPPGSPVVPIVTSAFHPVTLAAGVQNIMLTQFHTTNAICYDADRSAKVSTSVDIDVRLPSAGVLQMGSQVLGKRFNVAYTLQCR
jgi:hypothetical protein